MDIVPPCPSRSAILGQHTTSLGNRKRRPRTFSVNVFSILAKSKKENCQPQPTRSNLDQKVSEQSLSAERSSPIRSITEHSFPLCCCVIVLALPLPDRCRNAGHLATLAKRLEGKHLGLSVAVDSLAECSHATPNTSPALQLLPKARFRDKDLVVP